MGPRHFVTGQRSLAMSFERARPGDQALMDLPLGTLGPDFWCVARNTPLVVETVCYPEFTTVLRDAARDHPCLLVPPPPHKRVVTIDLLGDTKNETWIMVPQDRVRLLLFALFTPHGVTSLTLEKVPCAIRMLMHTMEVL